MPRAFLGLGSNLGDRLASLRRAVEALRERGVEVLRSSRVYETDPVGGPEQPDYLNAVIEVEVEGSARDLLATCQAIEEEMGRVRAQRWGPRTVDLDLLTFDDQEIEEPDLEVPHPRMHERAFVLAPLLELTADPMLPGGRRVADLRLGPELLLGARPYAAPLV